MLYPGMSLRRRRKKNKTQSPLLHMLVKQPRITKISTFFSFFSNAKSITKILCNSKKCRESEKRLPWVNNGFHAIVVMVIGIDVVLWMWTVSHCVYVVRVELSLCLKEMMACSCDFGYGCKDGGPCGGGDEVWMWL